MQAVCTCMPKNKAKVLEAGREKLPTLRTSQLLRRPIKLLKKEYRLALSVMRERLSQAALTNDINEVDRLCTRWYCCDEVMYTIALHNAANRGYKMMLRVLLECGASIEAHGKDFSATSVKSRMSTAALGRL